MTLYEALQYEAEWWFMPYNFIELPMMSRFEPVSAELVNSLIVEYGYECTSNDNTLCYFCLLVAEAIKE